MKKSIFGLILAVIALAAVALVPAATADLYGSSGEGLYSDSLMTGGFCPQEVCITPWECDVSDGDYACSLGHNSCNTARCKGGISQN